MVDPYARSDDQIFAGAGQTYGVDPDVLRAVQHVESGGNDRAVSDQGAQGPMQFLPSTARGIGIGNTFDREQAVYGAAKLLRQNLDQFGGRGDFAIAAYHGGTDPANWGPKTRDYLDKVSQGYDAIKSRRAPPPPSDPDDPYAQFVRPQQAPQAADDPYAQFLKPPPSGKPSPPAAKPMTDQSPDRATANAKTLGSEAPESPPVPGRPAPVPVAAPAPTPPPQTGSTDINGRPTWGDVGQRVWGAMNAPGEAPIDPTTQHSLEQAGIYPQLGGGFQPVREINKALIGGAAAGADVLARGFRGAQEAADSIGEKLGMPQLGRDVAALPEALMGHAEVPGAFERGMVREGVGAGKQALYGNLSDLPMKTPEALAAAEEESPPVEPAPAAQAAAAPAAASAMAPEAPAVRLRPEIPSASARAADLTGFLEGDRQTYTGADTIPGGNLYARGHELESYPSIEQNGVRVWYKPGAEDAARAELEVVPTTMVRPEPEPLPAAEPGYGTRVEQPAWDPKFQFGQRPDNAKAPSQVSGQYQMVRPEDLRRDPERFQFKAADDRGVTGALAGTSRWEPDLADPITAWRDEDGSLYVVNGHQRHDLALRAESAGQDVQMPARIFDAADGYTPEYMRALGAYQNIAQGSGTAMDAARILRTPEAIPPAMRLPDLPPRSQLVQQAEGLSALSPEAFRMVEGGAIEPAYAALVGARITDPAEQIAALDVLNRAHAATIAQAAMIVEDVRNSGFLRGSQTTLFGEEQMAQSLFPERARVLENAIRKVRQVKQVFGTALEGEGQLAEAGNAMTREGNLQGKTANERILAQLQADASKRGPLSDALSDAARDLASGKPIAAVTGDFLTKARAIERRGPAEGIQPSALPHVAEPAGEAAAEPAVAPTGPITPSQIQRRDGVGYVEARRRADAENAIAAAQEPAAGYAGYRRGVDQRFAELQAKAERAKARAAQEPTIANDARQVEIPGTARSAVQGQAARDQTGRGGIGPTGEVKQADEGLFAPDTSGQGTLYANPLFSPAAWKRFFTPTPALAKPAEVLAQKHGLGAIVGGIKAAFSPTSLRNAKSMEAALRAHTSSKAQAFDQSFDALEQFRGEINRLPIAEQDAFTHRMETGQAQPTPQLTAVSNALRQQLDLWARNIQGLGKGQLKNLIQDYLPHIYSNYAEWKAKQMGLPLGQLPPTLTQQSAVMAEAGKRPLLGRASFLKPRSFTTLQDAMAAGLEPLYHNPVDATLVKLHEMQKFYYGQKLADQLKQTGIAQWMPYDKMRDAEANGWVKLDDKVFQPKPPIPGGVAEYGAYYAPESMARIFNNYMSQGWAGSPIYRGIRAANNALNQAQLGFSGFHASFVTADTAISKFALGIHDIMHGHPIRGIGEAALGSVGLPVSVVQAYRRGSALQKAWLDPASASPEMRQILNVVNAGGGRMSMPKIYQITNNGPFFHNLADLAHPLSPLHQAAQMFRDADGIVQKAVMTPLRIVGRTLETINQPLMGTLVPRVKAGVYFDMARNWLKDHPNATADELADAAIKMNDSIDNRLGQLNYDNLYWNKQLKDLAFITTRSVGWNLGTLRELGGAGVDGARMLRDIANGRAPDFTYRMAYAVALPIITAEIGALLTYAYTGTVAHGLDYFYPPTKEDRSERISIPGYLKDVVAAQHAPLQTILNKTSPALETAQELIHNRDFYGASIYDPQRDQGVGGVAAAYGNYLLNQTNPFSIRSFTRLNAQGADPLAQGLSFFGFQAAPKFIAAPQKEDAFKARDAAAAYKKRIKEEAQQGRIHVFGP